MARDPKLSLGPKPEGMTADRPAKTSPRPADGKAPIKVASLPAEEAGAGTGESGSGVDDLGGQAFMVFIKNRTKWTIYGYRRAGTSGQAAPVDGEIKRNCTGSCSVCQGERVFFIGCRTKSFEVEFLLRNPTGEVTVSSPYKIKPRCGGFETRRCLEDADLKPVAG